MSDKEDSDLYVAVPIAKINPEQKLCSDVFLKINEKFIKFKHENDVISEEKYDFFLSKSVKEIFILKEDIQKFMNWMKSIKEEKINEIVADVGEEHRELVEKREEIKEIVFETFADEELDSSNVEILQEQVSDMVEICTQNKTSQAIIAKLRSHSANVADHSVNVANISLYLAMVLGHGHQFVLENVYMGALFHDYGKAKIPPNILENPNNAMYSQAINEHPIKGAKMLAKIEGIPDQVKVIVAQHHEQHNGKGYPKGLAGDNIYELSKIVAVANYFDNQVLDNKKKPAEMYKLAAKAVEYDRGKQFDPAVMERVVDALKLAYAGYKR